VEEKGGDMCKYITLLCIAVLMSAVTRETNSSRIHDIKVHTINNVEMCISNYGKVGQNVGGEPGCWWPTGSGQNYMYGAGIWFGVRDPIGGGMYDTLVTIGYGPHSSETEFVPGLDGQSAAAEYTKIYMYPDPWPAPVDTFPMAPQDTVSHQDSWCCYNDLDENAHVPGDTRPIGIEIYQTVYAWDQSPVQDIIFLTWEVKNVSGNTLQDCIIGFCADCDIGNEAGSYANDICAGIVGRWYVVDGESIWVDNCAFQWQEEQEAGWTSYPGVICCDMVQTPFDLVPGEDKDGDGIPDEYECDSAYYWNNVPSNLWDVDNDNVPDWRDPSQWPQLYMTALKRFTLNLEPNLDNERYKTLAGYNFMTGLYQPYDTIPPQPDDQRFLMASGPFDLGPDSSVTIICAFMFADWYGLYGTPDTALALIDQYAEEWYEMYWHLYTGVEENTVNTGAVPISFMPNPVIDRAHLHFNLALPGHVTVKIYNAAGQVVKCVVDAERPAGEQVIIINTDGLSSGMYFAVLETGSHMETRSFVVLK
jgi:hypothetical protein